MLRSSRLVCLRLSKRGFISASESPPSFSRSASARTKLTIASPTTPARGTAQKSERSYVVGEAAREAAIPMDMTAQPWRDAERDDFKDAAERVFGLHDVLNARAHRVRGRGAGALKLRQCG